MATRKGYLREVQMAEQRINVNAATAQELTQLPGIGPVLAERIAAYRDTVRLFEEPAQITNVSGIGERTYRAIADRLAVAAPEELSRPTVEAPQEAMEETEKTSVALTTEETTEERAPSEAEALSEEQISPAEELEPEVKAVPAGEPMHEEELTSAEEATEESAVETTEEAPPEVSQVAEEAPPEAPEMLAEEEAAPEVEEEPTEERPEPTPAPSWWRRLAWLWTALLGGLLGMAFALVVFSAVNGSLDVGHSRAVVDVRGRTDSLATDINSLQGNVDGLRKRLDALEELTVRMDRVEATVGDLQEATVDLGQRADALEESIAAVVAELEAVEEQVVTLQEQAAQTRSFFQALQALLNDFFGEVEGESMVTPTPTPEGK